MDKAKQLTLFDCARKRCRTSSTSDSEEFDDVVVCVTTDSANKDSESATESNTNCSTVQALDRGDNLEQMEAQADIQESHNIIDCTLHGSPNILYSSPEPESEISDEQESVAVQTPDSSCSNAASLLQHTRQGQHKPYSSEPTDIAQGPSFPPVQPVGIKFPKTTFGNRTRSFNPAWYKSYEWLEYSVTLNACFCYPCRLFGSYGGQFSSRPEPAFTTNGFKNWKHATGTNGVLNGHANCQSHRQAMVAWHQYKKATQHGSTVSECLGNARSEMIQKNRHYVESLLQVLVLCCTQEISLRGHRESSDSANRGNFLAILSLVAKHDSVIQHKLSNGPRNAVYTSADIQNQLINTMACMVRESICDKIRKAELFSVLADEIKDFSKKEQLSIVIRYVDIESAIQYEHFISYIEATSLNAESLSSYIIATLRDNRLNISGLVSQGYDGASVMSGHCSGVQQRIRAVAPQAIYVHCYAHCLNLVLVDASKKVSDSADFFAIIESLYVFLSSSKAHVIYCQQQATMHPDKPVRKLQSLSDTRWACRYLAIDAIISTYDVVLSSLEIITDGDDRVKAVEAEGLLHQIKSFKFLISLILLWRIFSCTKSLSDQLQSKTINLAKAAELVTSTIDTLQLFRSDQEWEKHYKYATDVAALHSISIIPQRPRRNRQIPQRLQDGIVLETTGTRDNLTTSQQYKTALYFPILDTMIAEMKKRFDDKNLRIMEAVECCNPSSPSFLEFNCLLPVVDIYGCHLNQHLLQMECTLAKQTLQGKEMKTINDVLKELSPLKTAFPNLVRVLQLVLTIAVSTASCERSFSSLKRIKTYLRSTMSEQRLNDIALLSIENKVVESLSLNDVIDRFAAVDKNRRILLH